MTTRNGKAWRIVGRLVAGGLTLAAFGVGARVGWQVSAEQPGLSALLCGAMTALLPGTMFGLSCVHRGV